jgi:hypothetical protein
MRVSYGSLPGQVATSFVTTADSLESPVDDAMWRDVCHKMISVLPSSLLMNAAESIAEVYRTTERYPSAEVLFVGFTPSTEIIESFVSRVEAMRDLPTGWDGYGTEAPSSASCDLAVRILKSAAGISLYPTTVSPSAEGGVAVSFVRGERVATIECLNEGSVLAVRSDRVNRPTAWELSGEDKDIRDTLTRIATFLG